MDMGIPQNEVNEDKNGVQTEHSGTIHGKVMPSP